MTSLTTSNCSHLTNFRLRPCVNVATDCRDVVSQLVAACMWVSCSQSQISDIVRYCPAMIHLVAQFVAA